MLIQHGTPVTVAFGVAVLVLPVIGIWFLWKNTRFVRTPTASPPNSTPKAACPSTS